MSVGRLLKATVVASLCLYPAVVRGQISAEERQNRHDQLIAADRAAADTTVAKGFAAGLTGVAAADLVLVYPGAPVIAGRDAVKQLLDAQAPLKSITLRWVPLYAEVSKDGSFGVSYGVTGISSSAAPPAGPLRFGKYISAWRREGSGWVMVGHVQVGLLPAAQYTAPAGFTAPSLAAVPASGPVADFARADLQFAALAGKQGAPLAFEAFAAGDAVTFHASGELARGPAAIKAWLGGDDSAWEWRPVAGGGAADLGFTVGESVITAKGEAPSYGKYLTLWRREAGGAVKYIADGGNARPAPGR